MMTKEIALKWYKQALHDLKMAEKNISIAGYDVAAFLAHQSVEKLMKSAIAYQGKKIPRTHYIDDLARELELGEDIMDEVLDLTVDYTFARYPDVSQQIPYQEYDEEIAKDKVAQARKIFQAVKRKCRELKGIKS